MCPYYVTDSKKCNLHGYYGEYPDLSQRDKACLHSSYWKDCEAYRNSDMEKKIAKKVRPNPDL